MSAAHTPGPWHLSEETERDGLRSRLVHGMPEGMLAIVRTEHQGRYYGDANARLVASAPDMLAALRKAEQFIINGVELGFIRMPDAGTTDPAHDTLPSVRAAIAKASPP